jgi:aminoglycoside/choline kinase family phosphotransferase
MAGDDTSDPRLAVLTRWVRSDLGFADSRIAPASADASFRRYFRVTPAAGAATHEPLIVMDAPPGKEDVAPFLRVARMLEEWGLNVPVVLARNLAEGLLLMTDLGSTQYLTALAANRDVERQYADALAALCLMQTRGEGAAALPPYDGVRLGQELALMPEWFLGRHLGVAVEGADRSLLEALDACLIASALAQPRVFVHRDFHSRNLMLCERRNPGILDFQDAVFGPITYDLVSLLKDCYITWAPGRVRGWALRHRANLVEAGVETGSEEQFLRWFDLMGLQRHIKVLGIFARLHYRDHKPQYLLDLPRVFAYVRETAALYRETAAFAALLARLEPVFVEAQARALEAAAQSARAQSAGDVTSGAESP